MRRVLGKQRRLNCSFSLKREREERSETPYNNTFPHVFKGIRSCDDPNTSTIPATTRTKAKRRRQAPTPHNSPNWSQRKGSDTQTDMLQRELCSAICVQRFDDSLGSAIHITYRSSLRSSSMHEPRDPPLKVVNIFWLWVYKDRPKKQDQAFYHSLHSIIRADRGGVLIGLSPGLLPLRVKKKVYFPSIFIAWPMIILFCSKMMALQALREGSYTHQPTTKMGGDVCKLPIQAMP